MAEEGPLTHDDRFALICEAEEGLPPEEVSQFRARLILELSLHLPSRSDLQAAIIRALPEEGGDQ